MMERPANENRVNVLLGQSFEALAFKTMSLPTTGRRGKSKQSRYRADFEPPEFINGPLSIAKGNNQAGKATCPEYL